MTFVWFLVFALSGTVPIPYVSKADCQKAAAAATWNAPLVLPQVWTGSNIVDVYKCVPAPVSPNYNIPLALPATIP
jgi:hypothetical protein